MVKIRGDKGERGVDIKTNLRHNGSGEVTLRITLSTVIKSLPIILTLLGAIAVGINWAKEVQETTIQFRELRGDFRTLQIVSASEVASQRVMIEALLRRVIPEPEADIIIEQAEMMRVELIKVLESQIDE